jgi:hypothetical protein
MLFAVVCCFAVACIATTDARAEKVSRFKHADRNDDGSIDRKEWKMERASQQLVEAAIRIMTARRSGRAFRMVMRAHRPDGDGVIAQERKALHARSKVNNRGEGV